MIKPVVILLIALFFFSTSCQSDKKAESTVEGIWKSIGYGKILAIKTDNYAFYDVTSISCLPAEQGSLASFGDRLSLQNDTLSIKKGSGRYRYTRIQELPELCSQEVIPSVHNDPVYNFEVLASTIQEHFAYFKRNKINWDSLYNASKAKITPESSEAELYLVLEKLMLDLKDNHGYIEPTDDVDEQAEHLRTDDGEHEENESLKTYGDFQIAQMVAASFLEEDMTKDSWLVHWGKMKDTIGYIQVKAMWLYADLNLSDTLVKKDGFVATYADALIRLNEAEYISKEVEGIRQVMDAVMQDLYDTRYIILDVRFNGGGQDAVSLEILRRFNDKTVKAATKKAIHNDGFTAEVPIILSHSAKAYKKPVYLLTSQQSASATDFMALASLELDNVKRIGSHTSGALSDALEKKLPNGWYFSISNEIYVDNKGICYESVGIPVDYELNYPEDRQSFFRSVADDLEHDKRSILNAIEALQAK